MEKNFKMVSVGALVAIVSVVLVMFGNPLNMGFCVACFLRDTAGALGLHSASVVQYARPEIIGIIIGAFAFSIFTKEFSVKGGSSPVTRFVLSVCLMVGALIFLGCPLRMVLRIAGGDLNAVVGLFGFATGILIGIQFLNRGFTLERTYNLPKLEGVLLPFLSVLLLLILVFFSSILFLSTEGPGASHAPVFMSLAAGLIVGVVGFVSRLCFVAGIRDSVLFKNFSMLIAFISIIVVGMILNIALDNFHLGFVDQPIAHTESLWNFLGLMLVGLCAVLLGGCPFRQLVLAGSGNSDSVICVFGMIFGGALVHNLNLASSGKGVTTNGKIGFVVCLIIVLVIAVYNSKRKVSENK